MQITITENNEHEGESFSYIFNDVSEDFINSLKDGFLEYLFEEDIIEIEENTSYTEEQVDLINKTSKNTYMDRMGFYKIPDLTNIPKEEYYESIFYKAVGLEKIVKQYNIMQLNIHIPKLIVPDYLQDKKEEIENNINNLLQSEMECIVDRYIRLYKRHQEVLNCNHKFETKNQRTSAYDTENITKCIHCNFIVI